jgi:hypothetical protein
MSGQGVIKPGAIGAKLLTLKALRYNPQKLWITSWITLLLFN